MQKLFQRLGIFVLAGVVAFKMHSREPIPAEIDKRRVTMLSEQVYKTWIRH